MNIKLMLNREAIEADVHPGQTLFEFLRDRNIKSVKYGCDHGECGACTVLINDKAFNSCLILMYMVNGKTVETVESLSLDQELNPIQESFLEEGAVQCGYCTPGMIMSVESLLRLNGSELSERDIRDALAGNLCRCTGYVKPVEAVKNLA